MLPWGAEKGGSHFVPSQKATDRRILFYHHLWLSEGKHVQLWEAQLSFPSAWLAVVYFGSFKRFFLMGIGNWFLVKGKKDMPGAHWDCGFMST